EELRSEIADDREVDLCLQLGKRLSGRRRGGSRACRRETFVKLHQSFLPKRRRRCPPGWESVCSWPAATATASVRSLSVVRSPASIVNAAAVSDPGRDETTARPSLSARGTSRSLGM